VLILNGADIHPRDGINKTPLRRATERNHPKVAAVLRQYGAKQ
jgi:ankyrin repeat protein